ncbi:MAG: hypothetical protein AB8B93_17590 [Pseudomonadales bacterium]
MQPRLFSGSSVREVLTEVREALGRDALILEQRSIGSKVEVLATLGEAEETPAQRISAKLQFGNTAVTENLYVRRLRDTGFGESLLSRLPAELPDWSTAMSALVRQLPIAARLPASGLVTFNGPAGAGVTSSVIRYAVHLLRSGKDPQRLRLVQQGNARLGGDEALQLAGQSLDITVERVPMGQVLNELAVAHPETLVLVDQSMTESCSESAAHIQDPLVPEQEFLVLPAHWHADALNRWLAPRRESAADPYRTACVITNADRGPRWGEWLSLLAERQWPLAMVSHGPHLPGDMTIPKASWLSDQLYDQIDRSETASKVKTGVHIVDE